MYSLMGNISAHPGQSFVLIALNSVGMFCLSLRNVLCSTLRLNTAARRGWLDESAQTE